MSEEAEEEEEKRKEEKISQVYHMLLGVGEGEKADTTKGKSREREHEPLSLEGDKIIHRTLLDRNSKDVPRKQDVLSYE